MSGGRLNLSAIRKPECDSVSKLILSTGVKNVKFESVSDTVWAVIITRTNGRQLLFQASSNSFGFYYWNDSISNWTAIRTL